MGNALLVCGFERGGDLFRDPQRLVDRQRSPDGGAFDVFHDQAVRTDVVQRADVGVIERRDCAGLVLEALRELLVGRLDGADPIQPGVTGFPDLAHVAAANRRGDLVGPERVAGAE